MPDPGFAGPRSLFDTHCRRAGRACRSSPRRPHRRRPPSGRRLPARTLTSGIDRAIRLSTAEARQASPRPDPASTPVTASP
jgi:hypothetical protein